MSTVKIRETKLLFGVGLSRTKFAGLFPPFQRSGKLKFTASIQQSWGVWACLAAPLAPAFSIAEDIRHAFPEEAGSRSTVYFLTSSIVEGSRASVSFATFGLS